MKFMSFIVARLFFKVLPYCITKPSNQTVYVECFMTLHLNKYAVLIAFIFVTISSVSSPFN